jgi:hypothetical protein
MSWLILLPAILVPVVLLCGFAGCDPEISIGDDRHCAKS